MDAQSQHYVDVAAAWTIPALLHRNATEHPDKPALSILGGTETLTWREFRDRVADVSRGLAGLGLASGDKMLILMPGQVEHWIVDQAATHLGAVPCTAYATLSTDQLRYLAQHSAAPVIVVAGAAELARLGPALPDLPALRHVIVVDESAVASAGPHGISLREVTEAGARAHRDDPGAFEAAWRAIRSDQPLTLLYTSGTTGDPKGVVLSHFNVIYQTVIGEALVPVPDFPRSVAYLPLAHIAERVLGIYSPIYRVGHAMIVPEPGLLVPGLQAQHPVSFLSLIHI